MKEAMVAKLLKAGFTKSEIMSLAGGKSESKVAASSPVGIEVRKSENGRVKPQVFIGGKFEFTTSAKLLELSDKEIIGAINEARKMYKDNIKARA